MSEQPHEFACTGPITAVVHVGAGDIQVAGEERSTARVSITASDGSEASRTAAANTRVEFDGTQLRVHTPDHSGHWLRRGGRVRVQVQLPHGTALRVETGSADLRLDGRLGGLAVKTGSGDATVDTITGDLTMTTGSGDLRAQRIGGALRVHTGSGDIRVRAATGEIDVDTASGDVVIDAAGGAVQARSASGDVRIQSVRGDQLQVNTASGDVSVGVPAGTRVWLDLLTASGSTRSDLQLSAEPPADGAQLNLSIRTASGDIDVHRVLASAA